MELSSTDRWSLFGVDVAKLVRAWWAELSRSIPERVKKLFVEQPARLQIACRGRQCLVVKESDGHSEQVASFDTGTLEEYGPGFLAAHLENGGTRRGRETVVELLLDPAVLLRHRLELPIQLESNLRQGVGYQISRLTPFKEADLYYDVVVRAREPASHRIQAELVATPRVRVEPLLRELGRLCGREVDRLTTADLGQTANLLPRSRARFRPNRNFWLLLALLASLALVVVAPLLGKRSMLLEQQAAIRELQQSVGDLVRQKNTLEADSRSLAYIAERRRQAPRMATLVDELSHLVPDGIYLTQLAVTKGRVRLSGQGTNVVGLIDVLNDSDFVEEAKFDSTVSRNPRTGLDQFSIGATLVGVRAE